MPLFSKYTGAGNDFVIVRAEEIGLRDAGALARQMCPRSTGVGVDGLILIRSLSEELVRVRFINPDGSEFSTCGNGSRCAARYAVDRGLVPDDHILVTDDGEILARVTDAGVALEYSLDPQIERTLSVSVAGEEKEATLVTMGTPHLVIRVDDIEVEEFDEVCRPLRHLEVLGAPGANVHLWSRDGDRLYVRTFERGVEGETQACGSGCMATAFAIRGDVDPDDATEHDGPPVELTTRSGAVLGVEFLERERIRLSGPAVFLFDGVFPDTTP